MPDRKKRIIREQLEEAIEDALERAQITKTRVLSRVMDGIDAAAEGRAAPNGVINVPGMVDAAKFIFTVANWMPAEKSETRTTISVDQQLLEECKEEY